MDPDSMAVLENARLVKTMWLGAEDEALQTHLTSPARGLASCTKAGAW